MQLKHRLLTIGLFVAGAAISMSLAVAAPASQPGQSSAQTQSTSASSLSPLTYERASQVSIIDNDLRTPSSSHKLFYTQEDIENMPEQEIERRPLLYWRRWANRPPHVALLCTIFFCGTIIFSELFKNAAIAARDCCRKHFWRALGLGLFLATVMLSMARLMFIDPIGTPLGILLIGLYETIAMAGVAVGFTLIAEAVLRRLRLSNKLSHRPVAYRLTLTIIATLIVGFILAIPGIGAFPPIGIRIGAWIGMLGMGGLLKTRFGTRPV
ncbi:MAG TPA: hypothetical protein V6C81_15515 [Planktothrix sp.]|jgi:hypothetical protein